MSCLGANAGPPSRMFGPFSSRGKAGLKQVEVEAAALVVVSGAEYPRQLLGIGLDLALDKTDAAEM